MARPQKAGLDYFPLDTHLDQKLRSILMKYGATGWGSLVFIWQTIYESGYYLKTDAFLIESMALELKVDSIYLNDLIDYCCRWGIFNHTLWESEKVLTSKGIQKRYREIAKRRQAFEMVEYVVKDDAKAAKGVFADNNSVNVDNNSVNVDNNSVNVDNNEQSKVKESKEKKRDNKSPSIIDLFPESFKAMSEAFKGPQIARGLLATLKGNGWDDDGEVLRIINIYIAEIPNDQRRYYPMTSKGIVATFQKIATEFAGQEIKQPTRVRKMTPEQEAENQKIHEIAEHLLDTGDVLPGGKKHLSTIFQTWWREGQEENFRTVGFSHRKTHGTVSSPCRWCFDHWFDFLELGTDGCPVCKGMGKKGGR